MRYKEPDQLNKELAEVELQSGDPYRIREALVALSLNEPDGEWAQEVCLTFAASSDASIRAIAATCLGHLARIHRALDLNKVVPVLKNMMQDAEIAGYVETALDDIKMFMDRRTVERIWAES